jgi:acyl-CoA thioesterase I
MRSATPVLFALFLCGGCEEESWPTHVACVGDSITVGIGASAPAESYPAALQGMLGKRTHVEGFGRSGATMLGPGAGNIPYESQPEYAQATEFVAGAGEGARVAVVVLLGANDSKAANWDAPGRKDRFKADYAKLIDHFAAQPSRPTIYLATPVPTGNDPCCGIRGEVLVREIAPIVTELAASRALTVIDLSTPFSGHPDLLVDGVHLNDHGYEILATSVRDVLGQKPPRGQARPSWWGRLWPRG